MAEGSRSVPLDVVRIRTSPSACVSAVLLFVPVVERRAYRAWTCPAIGVHLGRRMALQTRPVQ
jgi:hypothetical protein